MKLDPGSAKARAEGCICDPQSPGHFEPMARRAFRVEKNCPVHGLAELKSLLENE